MAAESIKGYINLLSHQWNEQGKGLPDEDDTLAAMAKLESVCPADKWLESTPPRSSWEFFKGEILANFELIDGRWYNVKLHSMWLKQQDKRVAQVRGAESTNGNRVAKRSGKHDGNRVAKRAVRAHLTLSSVSVVTTKEKQTAERPDFDVWADGIYGRWKKYRDKTLAMHSLCELTGESAHRFEANYPKWLDYHERAGWQYAPTLAAFLHDRTYEHEPPAIGEPQRRKSAADEAQDRAIEQMKKQEGWE